MPTDTYITIRLEECAKRCLPFSQNLPHLNKELRNTLQTIRHPMQVAVLGRVSSSKSTFVNALMGDEVVEMGKMVTTFNVCHLTYGDASTPIEVVFKDGHRESIPRDKLSSLANHHSASDLKKDIQYIGITYPNEILKSINIIDTPGLDSTQGDDSKNTISYLEKIRPDAIVMLFTKGAIAKETLDVVNQYIGSEQGQLNISPLNAIGLYTKIDETWKADTPDISPHSLAEQTIKENIYRLFPDVQKSLFSISPICARLGLAASTTNGEDISGLRILSSMPNDVLYKMIKTDDRFSSTNYDIISGLSSEKRTSLIKKYGRYGIFSIVTMLQQKEYTAEAIKEMLDDISGLRKVRRQLLRHFGERAVLIKTQNMVTRIVSACVTERKSNPESIDTIDKIEREIIRTMSNIKEYKELDYLSKLYNGLDEHLEPAAVAEFKRICGESETDHSVAQRLGVSRNTSIAQMVNIIEKRMSDANIKANINMVRSPENAELYLMLGQSYQQLKERIKDMMQRKDDAERTLRVANDFFYGE